MAANHHIVIPITFISAIMLAMCSASTTIMTREKEQLVRLAVIEVDTSQIKPYNEFLREEIEVSIRLEPGVITLYGVAEKETQNV